MNEKDLLHAPLIIAKPDLATRVGTAVLAAFFGFMVVIFRLTMPKDKLSAGIALAFAVMPTLGLIWLFWYSLVKIEASEAGIRWRDFRGWHQLDWDEITDFHVDSKANFWLMASDGRKVAFERSWQNRELLQKAVIRLIGEQLGVREWALKGTRDCDLPRTFGYDARAIRRDNAVNFLPAAMVTIYFVFGLMIPPTPQQAAPREDPAFLAIFALGIACTLAFGIYLTVISRIPPNRLRERFTARVDGFVFDDGREATLVPWESVTGFDFSPTRTSRKWVLTSLPRRIRTDCGQEFSFYASLDLNKASHWEAIMRHCAVHAIESRIDGDRTEALGGIAARWSGGVEGQGDRVFSAWTRMNRSLFVRLPALVCVVPVTIPLPSFSLNHEPISPWMFVFLAAMVAAIVASRSVVKSIRVQIGKEGISYLRPWKKETLAWSEIERVEQDGQVTMLYRADGSALRINALSLAYGSQIAPLIDERLREAREVAAINMIAETGFSATDG